MNQASHARDEHHHHGRQVVNMEGERYMEVIYSYPIKKRYVDVSDRLNVRKDKAT